MFRGLQIIFYFNNSLKKLLIVTVERVSQGVKAPCFVQQWIFLFYYLLSLLESFWGWTSLAGVNRLTDWGFCRRKTWEGSNRIISVMYLYSIFKWQLSCFLSSILINKCLSPVCITGITIFNFTMKEIEEFNTEIPDNESSVQKTSLRLK